MLQVNNQRSVWMHSIKMVVEFYVANTLSLQVVQFQDSWMLVHMMIQMIHTRSTQQIRMYTTKTGHLYLSIYRNT